MFRPESQRGISAVHLVAMRRVSIMFHHVNSASSKPEALSGRLIFASGWRRPMYYQIVPEPDDLAP